MMQSLDKIYGMSARALQKQQQQLAGEAHLLQPTCLPQTAADL